MNLYNADSSEIVRGHLRDNEHLDQVQNEVTSLVSTFFGRRGIAIASNWLPTLSRVAYYGATTISGVQTIGEEYLGLVQVDGSDPSYVASDLSRFMASMFECFHEVAVSKIFKKLSDQAQLLRSQNHIHPTLFKISQDLPSLSHAFIDFIKAFTIALFYLFKTPYHDVSKALTDIRYRSIRPQANFQTEKLYKLIGLASLFRLFFTVKQKLDHYAEIENENDAEYVDPKDELSKVGTSFVCVLCCESSSPVSTPCGHVFCWKCIERSKSAAGGSLQCPTCRFQFLNGRSVPLLNL